jgi:triphosphatase
LTAQPLPPETLSSLATQVLAQHAGVFLEHAPGVRTGGDPRHVHQMRVAARRMRAALRLFADVLPAEATGLSLELEWIAGHLGAVRDIDVHTARLRETDADLGLGDALVPYTTWLQDQWQVAQRCLLDALHSERFSLLVHRFTQFSDWPLEPPTDAPLVDEAPRRLRRAYRSLHRSAEPLGEDAPPQALHKTRIRAKRLRYATEFFEPLYDKPARRMIDRTVALQDLLGALQDSVVGAERIHDAIRQTDGNWSARTSLALGQILQYDVQRGEKLRQGFPAAYADVKASWKRLRRDLRL